MPSVDDVMQQFFDSFVARNAAGFVALFAEDGVLNDPHYVPPIGPVMQGHQAIQAGMEWAFGVLEWSRFSPQATFLDPADASRGALEVATVHKLFNGPELEFSQVFVVELDPGDLIRRVQSYTPYPPQLQLP